MLKKLVSPKRRIKSRLKMQLNASGSASKVLSESLFDHHRQETPVSNRLETYKISAGFERLTKT
jgi:hypothetical protein